MVREMAQVEVELPYRSLTRQTLHIDAALHRLNQLLADDESEPHLTEDLSGHRIDLRSFFKPFTILWAYSRLPLDQ